jgi:hypothetical protein
LNAPSLVHCLDLHVNTEQNSRDVPLVCSDRLASSILPVSPLVAWIEGRLAKEAPHYTFCTPNTKVLYHSIRIELAEQTGCEQKRRRTWTHVPTCPTKRRTPFPEPPFMSKHVFSFSFRRGQLIR